MTIKLYGAAMSPYVRKTRILLQEKGISFESIHVDPTNFPDNFTDLSPFRRIPALEDGDIQLADSAVIGAYIEREYPEALSLYPSSSVDYAKVIWFEKFADYELAPQLTFAVFRNRIVHRLIGKPCDEEVIKKAMAGKIPKLMDYLESQLTEGQNFIVGDKLSAADIAIASQFVNFRHGQESVDASRWPKTAKYVEQLLERPTFKKALEKEGQFVQKVLAPETA